MFTRKYHKLMPTFWLISLAIIIGACQLQIPATIILNTPEVSSLATQTNGDDSSAIISDEAAEDYLISTEGSWLLLNTSSGLWIQSTDGSTVNQIFDGTVLAPKDLHQGFARSTNMLAFITGQDYSEMTLVILKLPEGRIVETIPLISPENSSGENFGICDPAFEALRAITIGSPVAWSPDQTQLAFIGVIDGESSDVYLYQMADGSIHRISQESRQAYELHWASNDQRVTYFSASCFGTGAGFSEIEIGVVDSQTGLEEMVADIGPNISGLEFVTWTRSDVDQMIVASTSGCPYRDLRIIDLDNSSTSILFEGCFDDYAVGPTGSVGIVVGKDLSDQPGVLIFAETDIAGIPPVVVPDETVRAIQFISSTWFVQTISGNSSQIYALDWSGNILEEYEQISFPAISKDESVTAWSKNGKLLLMVPDKAEPLELSQCEVNQPFWYEAEWNDGEIYQYFLYECTAPERGLFLMKFPGSESVLVSADIELISEPIVFFSD